MKDVRIHYFPSVRSKYSSRTIALGDFLGLAQFTSVIKDIRSGNQNSTEYNKLKKKLPIVLFNVGTNGGKKDVDVKSFNPFLYLDVDKIDTAHFDEVKQEILRVFPAVLMCWRSCGGRGLGILIHTTGIGDHNWPSIRDHFAQFAFHGYRFDPKCFTRTRPTFVSIDEEAYINWDAPALDLSHLTATQSYEMPPPSPKDKTPENAGMGKHGGLRFSNIDSFFTGNDHDTPYLLFPDGVTIIQVERSYRKVTAGDRNAFIFRNLVRIRHLNPTLPYSVLTTFARKLNDRCAPRLDDEEVSGIANKVYFNKYPAFPNRRRKILFNPRIKKSAIQKQSDARRAMNQVKGEQTAARIYKFIEEYAGERKLTNRMIMMGTGIPLRTVERHTKQFREIINHNYRTKTEARPIQAEATVRFMERRANDRISIRSMERFVFPLPEARLVLLPRGIS